MGREIYKLQLWTESNEGDLFKDLYFDVSRITGFFIPEDDTPEAGKGINIFFDGDMITIKQEQHIVNYLTNNFVELVKN